MKACPQCGKIYDDAASVCADDNSRLTTLSTAANDQFVGRLLDGRYRLLQKIGEGGMGCIYRSVHTEMGRTCAIKLLTAVSPGKEDALARFKREAKMASRIDNAHAVTIYDFGAAEDGTMFLAMEFIDGKPLSKVIAAERPLSAERVVHITSQIAEGLAAAHAMEIVHRDLKPDNIMVTHKGGETDYVKVLDFGIAKTVADDSGDHLTKTGFVLGTPVYMSPEQLLGEKLDPRSDIYSLAIIVYEMLSGRLPFEGENPQAVMMKRILSEPIRLRTLAPHVSDSIERVVMEGLERDRQRRTPTVEAFAAELRSALRGQTQVMGGRVTELISDSTDTQRWSAIETNPTTATPGQPTIGGHGSGSQGPYPADQPRGMSSMSPTLPQTRVGFSSSAPPTTLQQPPSGGVYYGGGPQISGTSRSRGKMWLLISGVVVLIAACVVAAVYLLIPSKPGTFRLTLKGLPPGASVYLNDNAGGNAGGDGTISIQNIAAGPTKLAVRMAGYEDLLSEVTGAAGESKSLEVKMLPLMIHQKGDMVLISAGEFEMGDNGHEADERPAHVVTLPAFYIDAYEVTNAQYKQFCDETHHPYPPNPGWDPQYFEKSDYPVLGIEFADAKAYAAWAGKRLPTEEEWEKAASWDPVNKKKRLYPWGNNAAPGRANIKTGKVAPVTAYQEDRSGYGVYGMAGNAWEWVDSLYKPYPNNTTPSKEYALNRGAIRGGVFFDASSFPSPNDQARTSYRNFHEREFPAGEAAPIGIRCALSADAAQNPR
jgi:serine/threonine protein kinase/formylglycine-generating enzyme required for sulfatase activity